jgi:hypothetical protein
MQVLKTVYVSFSVFDSILDKDRQLGFAVELFLRIKVLVNKKSLAKRYKASENNKILSIQA